MLALAVAGLCLFLNPGLNVIHVTNTNFAVMLSEGSFAFIQDFYGRERPRVRVWGRLPLWTNFFF